MRWILGALALSLTGCPSLDATGGDGAAAGSVSSGSCSPLDGVYRISYTQRVGTCGAQPDESLEYRNGVAVPSGGSNCQAGGEAMTSPCQLRRSSRCAVSDPTTGSFLGYAQVSGTLTETDGNKRLEGELDISVSDTNGGNCESTYQVVFSKVR
jgi:hypothetical protein